AKAGYKISDTSLNVTEDKTITATDVWGVSGGADGSANNPYLISDVAGLQALADYVNGGGNTSNLNFKLAGNIDLKDVSNFTPIGTISNQFKGTFDGGKTYDAQGNCTETYTISNLTINSKDDNVGLFGYVGEGGTIKNVKLTDVDVTGGNWGTDALIGYSYATFENCSVIGGKVTGENGVGGLIGNNDYTVTGCTVDNVSVSATSNEGYADVGGLAGYNDGTVSGNIVIVSNISHQRDNDYVGGLVGFNDEGTVSDNKYCSTFAAVGENEYGTEKNNTRYYKLTLPDGVEVSGDNIFTFGGTTYAAGTVTLATKLGVVYSTENSFTITEDTTITVTDHWNALNGADGSKDKPYLISDVAGLQYLAEYVNGGGNTSDLNFKLNDNIDLSGVDFAPIGYYTDANNNNPFKGTFDGNNSAGYKISNLTVNTPDNNFVGLFGCVGTGGTIQNITLTDVNITGKNNVGGLLGDNEGEVTNCTVSGTVGGNSYVGGLVGLNAFGGRVENNTAITTVNGSNSPVGGVAGSNGSVATNNKFYGNQTDALGKDVVTDSKNTRYYKLTVPEDVTASGGNSFTFNGTTYATGTVTLLSAKTGYALNETSIDVAEDTDLSTTTFTATDVWGVESGANGSTANPYLISDVAGLQLLADYVNAGNTCAGLNFKLTADIDMSSVTNFTAIGNFTNKN
ncbi:MAG: hypothetical protein IKD80_08040, partial [Selenomonadaceae bacterium]|nr:hypothetical protein [Selenomonadaceae bacterium]